MKAIETQYKGYRFRSRLEARWAVFFDALGIKWEYEKEGFKLPSGLYLPDFWLPEDRMWVEIKGDFPSKVELQLAKELADGTGFGTFVFHANPTVAKCHGFVFEPWTDDTSILREWDDVVIYRNYDDGPRSHRVVFVSESWLNETGPGHWGGANFSLNDNDKGITKAADTAKSARFEHGESPDNRQRRRR